MHGLIYYFINHFRSIMKKSILLTALFLALVLPCFSQPSPQDDYFKDTVWTHRFEDQPSGFYMVKFSLTDSLIVAHGYDYDLFIDAKTGSEIHRILGENEVFFINHDSNFVRLNQARTKFEIFDTKTYLVIDSLESDGVIVNEYPIVDMSKDEKYLVAPIHNGFRIWDMKTKRILKTKIFPQVPNLIKVGVDNPRFILGSNNILAQFSISYKNPNNPNNPINWGDFTVYNFYTLDSMDSYGNHRGFVLSKTGKYIAYGTGDPNYGIEIYDFNTKQLIKKFALNGLNLTGIEFSPDDKYLVASAGPDDNYLKIWNIDSGNEVYSYLGSSFRNIDISHDGKYIIESVGRWVELLKTHFEPSLVNPIPDTLNQVIYPNPTTSKAIVQFNQITPEQTNIFLSDLNGRMIKNLFSQFLNVGTQSIELDFAGLSAGTYLVCVKNTKLSLIFKLNVNK